MLSLSRKTLFYTPKNAPSQASCMCLFLRFLADCFDLTLGLNQACFSISHPFYMYRRNLLTMTYPGALHACLKASISDRPCLYSIVNQTNYEA